MKTLTALIVLLLMAEAAAEQPRPGEQEKQEKCVPPISYTCPTPLNPYACQVDVDQLEQQASENLDDNKQHAPIQVVAKGGLLVYKVGPSPTPRFRVTAYQEVCCSNPGKPIQGSRLQPFMSGPDDDFVRRLVTDTANPRAEGRCFSVTIEREEPHPDEKAAITFDPHIYVGGKSLAPPGDAKRRKKRYAHGKVSKSE